MTRPCPFCGCTDVIFDDRADYYADGEPRMRCNDCGACGPGVVDGADAGGEAEARSLWNARASE